MVCSSSHTTTQAKNHFQGYPLHRDCLFSDPYLACRLVIPQLHPLNHVPAGYFVHIATSASRLITGEMVDQRRAARPAQASVELTYMAEVRFYRTAFNKCTLLPWLPFPLIRSRVILTYSWYIHDQVVTVTGGNSEEGGHPFPGISIFVQHKLKCKSGFHVAQEWF